MRPEPVPIEPTTERGSIHEEVVEVEAAALVGRYQDGETGALEVLHGRLERAIRKLLGRYELAQLPSTVTYQDLTQQGWVVLAEVAFRWRPTGRFLAYFFRSFPHEMDRYLTHARSGRHTQKVQVVGVPHDELDALLGEQVAYYRPRAGEYVRCRLPRRARRCARGICPRWASP